MRQILDQNITGERSFAGTSDITEIPVGMNGLPADSPLYTYVSGNEASEPQSQTLRATATASQTQTACRQCGSFTWRVEEKRHIGTEHSLTTSRIIK